MDKPYNVGIIGAGVSGVVTALHLANLGISTVLLEQKANIIGGPPFCHLHAGGNLYPDISDEQCRILLRQSIEMARLFPQSIDQRPTLLSVPKTYNLQPERIEKRLKMLVREYEQLIQEDPKNQILGHPHDYYRSYSQKELRNLLSQPLSPSPQSPEDWIRNAVEVVDWEKLKTPVFLVQEFGWNMFRLAATAEIALKSTEFCHLLTNTKVINIQDLRSDSASHNWEIQTEKEHFPVNYLINASGFQNRTLESFLPVKAEGWTEFKASYLSKWTSFPFPLPELVFHGERGTPTGMTQLTPYPEGFFQIHGMRPGISLFQGGLIKNLPQTRKPDFGEEIRRLLTRGWSPQEARGRTDQAIDFVSRFLPSFQSAEMGGLPLYGAQQIIGEEANLRVAEVSFPAGHYARIETIKASSTLSAARKISEDIFRAGLQEQGDLPPGSNAPGENALIQSVLSHEIDGVAKKITQNRGLPESLSRLLIPRGPGV